MKMVNTTRAICTLSLLLLTAPLSAASQFIGMNTNEAVWFDSSVPFANLFHTAEPFKTNKYTKGNISYDRNGWVSNLNGGQAGSYFARWLPVGTLPQGNYTVTYQGSGQLNYMESAQLIQRAPGRDIIRLAPDKNNEISAALVIVKSDPANPVRNIRVTLPGGICQNNPFKRVQSANQCGGKQFLPFAQPGKRVVFNPDYLNFMRQFRTVRFMGMSGVTRNDRERSWGHRAHLEEATWSGHYGERGIPLEVMVDLANTLGANAWFNIPHLADADYVQRYAQYVKDHLRPNLKAHVEYSNEVWNPVFSQAQYARREGYRDQLDPDPLVAGMMFYGFQSKRVFLIWERVFGNQKNRLVRVLSGWFGNPALTPHILKASNVYQQTDMFTVAPYFYASQDALMKARNVNDIFKLINGKQHYSLQQAQKHLQKHAEFLRPYKVPLGAYEGGQHLVHYGTKSKKQHPNPVLIAANRDPRMEHAYVQLLNGFRQAGGKLFMAFSSPRANAHFGFWGIKEHINQNPAHAPKYRALTKF
ncbi:MAG: hypothetical protein ACPGSM_07780 [Thiolinea sp.]